MNKTKEVKVVIFGTNASPPTEGCSRGTSPTAAGCCPTKTMEEETKSLEKSLKENLGKAVKFTYVDVESEKMKKYPKIQPILSNIQLPLVVLNDEPRFYGGISVDAIGNAIRKILSGEKNE